MPELDARAERNLISVHPDLVKVARRCAALCPTAFTVTEGLRTLERQKQLVAQGASKTMNSRHLTGHAIDIAAQVMIDGKLEITWKPGPYDAIAAYMEQASKFLDVPIKWGGLWKTLIDKPHYELSWDAYPLEPLVA